MTAEEQANAAFPEHSSVTLLRDLPAEGLVAGAVGTVVGSYGNGGYEVEFTEGEHTAAVVTLGEDDIRLREGR